MIRPASLFLVCALSCAGLAAQSTSPQQTPPPKPLTPWFLPGDPRAATNTPAPADGGRYGGPATSENLRRLDVFEQGQLAHQSTHGLPKPEQWQKDYVKRNGKSDRQFAEMPAEDGQPRLPIQSKVKLKKRRKQLEATDGLLPQ